MWLFAALLLDCGSATLPQGHKHPTSSANERERDVFPFRHNPGDDSPLFELFEHHIGYARAKRA